MTLLYDDLRKYNRTGIEGEISAGIIERIARDLPELNDHSPSSPHVVMAEAMGWGSSLLLYYLTKQPELYENWLIKNLYGATPRPPTNARAEIVMRWSTPAGDGGRLVPAGTEFLGGGTTWTVLEPYLYPPGVTGDEILSSEQGVVFRFPIPVVASAAGSKYNTQAGTITNVVKITPGLLSVTNPFPAFGGNDEESYESMRARTFSKRLEEDLLVVPRDFELAIAHYFGDSSRTWVITPPPVPGFVALSLLYPDGTPVVVDTGLEEHLNTRSPMAPVMFVPPEIVDLPIEADIKFDAQLTTPQKLAQEVEEVLATHFSPKNWGSWGETPNVVYRSKIISLLQGVRGVISAELISPSEDVDLGQPNAAPRVQKPVITANPIVVYQAQGIEVSS